MMKGRRFSLRLLVAGLAVAATVFCVLLVSLFPKVALLSACVISVAVTLFGALLIVVGMERARNPKDKGWDFWRNFPDDKSWP